MSNSFPTLLVVAIACHLQMYTIHAFLPRPSSNYIPRTCMHGSVISQILNKDLSEPKAQNRKVQSQPPKINTKFLSSVISEALYRQELILDALKNQDLEKASRSVETRRADVRTSIEKLLALQSQLNELSLSSKKIDQESKIQNIHDSIIGIGFGSILTLPPSSWKHKINQKTEFGRPKDWTGLVFHTPLGVPILIGKKGSHNDETLRRISQGSDLWFQVDDYAGSRVLLRTSLIKGFKNSKVCKQMAADFAAYYSDYQTYENVPIMYTDSRRVAKRGRVGQMKRKKSIGRMFGYPSDVVDMTRGQEP